MVELCDADQKLAEMLLEDLRSGPITDRIQECNTQLEDKPFSLGRMNLGGELAYFLVQLTEPETSLEVGVANGVSTTYVLGALEDLDHDADLRAIDKPLFESDIREKRGNRGLVGVGGIIPEEREAVWVAPKHQRVKNGHQYYVGDFVEVLPSTVESMDPLDLAIYDASKDSEDMRMAYETLINSLSTGGVLVSDDISVNSVFEDVTRRYDGETVTFGGCGIYRSTC